MTKEELNYKLYQLEQIMLPGISLTPWNNKF